MRVNIEHGTETTGFFKKATFYTVTTKVEFSEEEMAILKQADLWDSIMMERPLAANRRSIDDDSHWNLKVKDLAEKKGDVYIFNTTAEAQRYEDEMKEALTGLKQVIEDHRDVKVESKSFEL